MADTRIYFATNRRPNNARKPIDFTDTINDDLESFRVGTADVPGTKLYATDAAGVAKTVKIDVLPKKLDANDTRRAKVGSDEAFAGIRSAILEGTDVLLIIHGYNYTLRDAMARAAQVKQWPETDSPSGARTCPLVMMAFSRPSLGVGVTPKLYVMERPAWATGPCAARSRPSTTLSATTSRRSSTRSS